MLHSRDAYEILIHWFSLGRSIHHILIVIYRPYAQLPYLMTKDQAHTACPAFCSSREPDHIEVMSLPPPLPTQPLPYLLIWCISSPQSSSEIRKWLDWRAKREFAQRLEPTHSSTQFRYKEALFNENQGTHGKSASSTHRLQPTRPHTAAPR